MEPLKRYEQRLQAVSLALSPPHIAYEWLEKQAPNSSVFSADDFKFIEYVLSRRKDPLVDLALARFARSPFVVRRVFRKGGSSIRIAAWSNKAAGALFSSAGIWCEDRDLDSLIDEGSNSELEAFAGNPSLSEQAIEALVKKTGAYERLTELRYIRALLALGKSPRLSLEYKRHEYSDGMGEYYHNKVFFTVWSFSFTVPANPMWAFVLENVLRQCRVPSGMSAKMKESIVRWRFDNVRAPETKYYNPGSSFYLRMRLADAIVADEDLRKSDDLALRPPMQRDFTPTNSRIGLTTFGASLALMMLIPFSNLLCKMRNFGERNSCGSILQHFAEKLRPKGHFHKRSRPTKSH